MVQPLGTIAGQILSLVSAHDEFFRVFDLWDFDRLDVESLSVCFGTYVFYTSFSFFYQFSCAYLGLKNLRKRTHSRG